MEKEEIELGRKVRKTDQTFPTAFYRGGIDFKLKTNRDA